MADRSHEPAVESAQRVLGDLRQRVAVFLVAGLADEKLGPLDLKPCFGGGGFHHLDRFGDDLETDVVAVHDSDFQSFLTSFYSFSDIILAKEPGIAVFSAVASKDGY